MAEEWARYLHPSIKYLNTTVFNSFIKQSSTSDTVTSISANFAYAQKKGLSIAATLRRYSLVPKSLFASQSNSNPSGTAPQPSPSVNAPLPVARCILFNLYIETPIHVHQIIFHTGNSSLISAVAARSKCFRGEETPRQPF